VVLQQGSPDGTTAESGPEIPAVLGIEVPHRRGSVAMQPRDHVLVPRLVQRLPEGKLPSREELAAVDSVLG